MTWLQSEWVLDELREIVLELKAIRMTGTIFLVLWSIQWLLDEIRGDKKMSEEDSEVSSEKDSN